MINLRDKVEAEFENIDLVLKELPPYNQLPHLSTLELAGVSTLVHHFYNGIEMFPYIKTMKTVNNKDKIVALLRSVTCLLLLTACLSLTGCATTEGMFDSWSFFGLGEDTDEKIEPAGKLVTQGMDAFKIGRYNTAMEHFQEIKDQYPFSPEALLAELKLADCEFYNDNFQEAKELYKEFEERHPTNEAIPYVMFQIGMCDYSRTDRIDRDSTGAHDAIKSFSRLLRAYPDSPYTQEAKARIRAAREFIVNHEYYVAVFYVRTKKYEQAKHRLKYIVTMYPDASIIPKAKALQKRLAAGDPPKWGLDKWLPELSMPDWNLTDIGIGTADDEVDTPISE